MAVKTPNTQDEQDVANSPQSHYDDEFNRITQGHTSTAEDLQKLEDYANNNSTNGSGAEPNKNPSDTTKNIDDAKEREENSGWKNNYTGSNGIGNNKKKATGRFSGLKKKGPMAIIISLILGGGAFSFLGLSLLPVAVTESFINDSNDANSAQQHNARSLFGKKLGGDVKKKLSICTASISIRCKFNSLNEETLKKFKDNGFSFGDEAKAGSRTGFSSIKFPDGTVVNNVQDLSSHLDAFPEAASAFNKVYSFKNSLFVVGKFFSGVLDTLHLSKAKKISGNTADEADKSYTDATKPTGDTSISTAADPASTDPNATDAEKQAAAADTAAGNDVSTQINDAVKKGTKLDSLKIKAANALLPFQLGCMTYNMSQYISIAAKTVKAARYATFAMIFLTLAGSIKAGKATGPEVTKGTDVLSPSQYPDKVEDPATGQMIDNPDKGKNVTDAEAYKVVTYGDSIDLSSIAKKFIVAGGFLGVLDVIVSWMNKNIGKPKIKETCKIVDGKIASVIGFLAAPVAGLVLAGISAVLPIDKWAADLVNLLIDAASGVDLTTGIVGPAAGNLLFIGTSLIMGSTAMHYGLKPGKLAAIKQNIADNNNALQQQVAVEKYDAQKTPFAITNRYTFFGSLSYSLATYMPSGGQPFLLSASKILSAIPLSLASFNKNVGAAYTMSPAPYSDTRFQQCDDEVYNSLPMQADMFCVPRYVPAAPVDADVATDYMLANSQTDDTGLALPGSDYEKWTKYCTQRTDPWGSTSIAPEDQVDDARWYTGERCFDDTQQNQMFANFLGYTISEGNIEDSGSAGSASTQQQAFVDTGGDSTIGSSNQSVTATLGNMLQSLSQGLAK